MTKPNLVICDNNAALNQEAARRFSALAAEAIAARGRFLVSLSGGSTPKALYQLLATPEWRTTVNWSKTHLFWGDERFVPPDDPQSNYRMTSEALLSRIP
ncbi:MAG TPA: 6-phosphogluconolactonase, partial [Terriglobales bacterium]|nr:6-phosphogluconolactonase [Terriglobales bacterium]